MPTLDHNVRIFLIGLTTLDALVTVPEVPGPDQHAYLPNYRLLPGGSAANMAFCLAQLGASVHLCSRVGADIAGEIVRTYLSDAGVNVSCVAQDPTRPTGFSVISISDDGRIGLLHHEGANTLIAPQDVSWSAVSDCDIFHVGGAMSLKLLDGQPLYDLLKDVRARAGKLTSLHTSRNTDRKDTLIPSLSCLDYLFTNDTEALDISGQRDISDAANWFHDRGARIVAITQGSEGAYVSNTQQSAKIPAFSVDVVDTTGCGDAFVAGFLYTALKGGSIIESATWGNAVGARCAQVIGAMPDPFDHDSLVELVQSALRVDARTPH
jgi:sugar/nucleoside kinase (ribokinase family)